MWIQREIRRLRCRTCPRVVIEDVPWARHDSGFTRPFEDAVGLLARRNDKTTVAKSCGIAWVTVGKTAQCVVAELLDRSRLKDLRRIAVDEISLRKHQRYLTVVTDHDRRQVVWVAEGKRIDVLESFFSTLGADACVRIAIATMGMSAAYANAVTETLPELQLLREVPIDSSARGPRSRGASCAASLPPQTDDGRGARLNARWRAADLGQRGDEGCRRR
ncbi:MAG: transposase [Planctomycetes bacterium]|nr:transposase [Planctomycetota bacterium]